jgi:hypothetical protein
VTNGASVYGLWLAVPIASDVTARLDKERLSVPNVLAADCQRWRGMQLIMVFPCKSSWHPVGVPIVGGAEALRRFRPVRMSVERCPHCRGSHVYAVSEGQLRAWDGTQIVDSKAVDSR